jgi:hypothetical protein
MLTKARISREAKKIRHRIIRDIEQLKKGSSGKNEEEQLRSLEENMAQYVKPLFAPSTKDVTQEGAWHASPADSLHKNGVDKNVRPRDVGSIPGMASYKQVLFGQT